MAYSNGPSEGRGVGGGSSQSKIGKSNSLRTIRENKSWKTFLKKYLTILLKLFPSGIWAVERGSGILKSCVLHLSSLIRTCLCRTARFAAGTEGHWWAGIENNGRDYHRLSLSILTDVAVYLWRCSSPPKIWFIACNIEQLIPGKGSSDGIFDAFELLR